MVWLEPGQEAAGGGRGGCSYRLQPQHATPMEDADCYLKGNGKEGDDILRFVFGEVIPPDMSDRKGA